MCGLSLYDSRAPLGITGVAGAGSVSIAAQVRLAPHEVSGLRRPLLYGTVAGAGQDSAG